MRQKRLSEAERAILSEKDKKYDPDATSDDCIVDLRKIQEKFPLKYITRNFYRINGKYSDSTWNKYFGTFHEYRRQAGLELSRDQHSLERQIAKHASIDVYRQFYKEEILPYHQKFQWSHKQKGRFKTILIGSDFHDQEVDEFCLSVFIDTAKRLQPDIITLNGDIFDLYEFSRFDIDLRKIQIKPRFDFVRDRIFAPLRKFCPDAQIDFVCGNHEYRLLKILASHSPALKVLLSDVMGLSLRDIFGLENYQINLVAKFDLSAFNIQDVKDEIKQNYQVYYDSFVCSHYKDLSFGLSGASGHTHRPEQITFSNLPMGRLTWTTTGCMHKIDAEYIDGFCEWQNSFLIVVVDREQQTVSHHHHLIPGDFVVVEGKLYTRKDE